MRPENPFSLYSLSPRLRLTSPYGIAYDTARLSYEKETDGTRAETDLAG